MSDKNFTLDAAIRLLESTEIAINNMIEEIKKPVDAELNGSYSFPMVFRWFSHGFLMFSSGFPKGFPMNFPVVFLLCSYCFPVVFQRFYYGFPMVLLWFSYNFPMVFRVVFVWSSCSFPVVFL